MEQTSLYHYRRHTTFSRRFFWDSSRHPSSTIRDFSDKSTLVTQHGQFLAAEEVVGPILLVGA